MMVMQGQVASYGRFGPAEGASSTTTSLSSSDNVATAPTLNKRQDLRRASRAAVMGFFPYKSSQESPSSKAPTDSNNWPSPRLLVLNSLPSLPTSLDVNRLVAAATDLSSVMGNTSKNDNNSSRRGRRVLRRSSSSPSLGGIILSSLLLSTTTKKQSSRPRTTEPHQSHNDECHSKDFLLDKNQKHHFLQKSSSFSDLISASTEFSHADQLATAAAVAFAEIEHRSKDKSSNNNSNSRGKRGMRNSSGNRTKMSAGKQQREKSHENSSHNNNNSERRRGRSLSPRRVRNKESSLRLARSLSQVLERDATAKTSVSKSLLSNFGRDEDASTVQTRISARSLNPIRRKVSSPRSPIPNSPRKGISSNSSVWSSPPDLQHRSSSSSMMSPTAKKKTTSRSAALFGARSQSPLMRRQEKAGPTTSLNRSLPDLPLVQEQSSVPTNNHNRNNRSSYLAQPDSFAQSGDQDNGAVSTSRNDNKQSIKSPFNHTQSVTANHWSNSSSAQPAAFAASDQQHLVVSPRGNKPSVKSSKLRTQSIPTNNWSNSSSSARHGSLHDGPSKSPRSKIAEHVNNNNDSSKNGQLQKIKSTQSRSLVNGSNAATTRPDYEKHDMGLHSSMSPQKYHKSGRVNNKSQLRKTQSTPSRTLKEGLEAGNAKLSASARLASALEPIVFDNDDDDWFYSHSPPRGARGMVNPQISHLINTINNSMNNINEDAFWGSNNVESDKRHETHKRMERAEMMKHEKNDREVNLEANNRKARIEVSPYAPQDGIVEANNRKARKSQQDDSKKVLPSPGSRTTHKTTSPNGVAKTRQSILNSDKDLSKKLEGKGIHLRGTGHDSQGTSATSLGSLASAESTNRSFQELMPQLSSENGKSKRDHSSKKSLVKESSAKRTSRRLDRDKKARISEKVASSSSGKEFSKKGNDSAPTKPGDDIKKENFSDSTKSLTLADLYNSIYLDNCDSKSNKMSSSSMTAPSSSSSLSSDQSGRHSSLSLISPSSSSCLSSDLHGTRRSSDNCLASSGSYGTSILIESLQLEPVLETQNEDASEAESKPKYGGKVTHSSYLRTSDQNNSARSATSSLSTASSDGGGRAKHGRRSIDCSVDLDEADFPNKVISRHSQSQNQSQNDHKKRQSAASSTKDEERCLSTLNELSEQEKGEGHCLSASNECIECTKVEEQGLNTSNWLTEQEMVEERCLNTSSQDSEQKIHVDSSSHRIESLDDSLDQNDAQRLMQNGPFWVFNSNTSGSQPRDPPYTQPDPQQFTALVLPDGRILSIPHSFIQPCPPYLVASHDIDSGAKGVDADDYQGTRPANSDPPTTNKSDPTERPLRLDDFKKESTLRSKVTTHESKPVEFPYPGNVFNPYTQLGYGPGVTPDYLTYNLPNDSRSLFKAFGVSDVDYREHSTNRSRHQEWQTLDRDTHSGYHQRLPPANPFRTSMPLYHRPQCLEVNEYVHLSNADRLANTRSSGHRGRTFQRFQNERQEQGIDRGSCRSKESQFGEQTTSEDRGSLADDGSVSSFAS